jgi:hypothetical protein
VEGFSAGAVFLLAGATGSILLDFVAFLDIDRDSQLVNFRHISTGYRQYYMDLFKYSLETSDKFEFRMAFSHQNKICHPTAGKASKGDEL